MALAPLYANKPTRALNRLVDVRPAAESAPAVRHGAARETGQIISGLVRRLSSAGP
ncbi:MAG: hypothetical protein JNK82_37910, partial [Myxococcaceae bacterium]|nr:hypothetical protein [Myxococcaceae bacterium]